MLDSFDVDARAIGVAISALQKVISSHNSRCLCEPAKQAVMDGDLSWVPAPSSVDELTDAIKALWHLNLFLAHLLENMKKEEA